jgi:hypothetical protein
METRERLDSEDLLLPITETRRSEIISEIHKVLWDINEIDRLKRKQAELRKMAVRLQDILDAGEEKRSVDIRIIYTLEDNKKPTKQVFRVDTGEQLMKPNWLMAVRWDDENFLGVLKKNPVDDDDDDPDTMGLDPADSSGGADAVDITLDEGDKYDMEAAQEEEYTKYEEADD